MSLKTVVEGLRRGLIVPLARWDPTIEVGRIAESLELRFDKGPTFTPIERKDLIRRLKQAASTNSFEDIPAADLKRAADCLFDPLEKLLEVPGFLDGYLTALGERGTAAALVRLVSIYCVHFDPRSSAIAAIAFGLKRNLDRLPAIWRERQARYAILEPSTSARGIAAALVDAPSPRDALAAIGLGGRRGATGLAAHVCRAAVTILGERLTRDGTRDHVARIIQWAASPDGRTLQFLDARAAVANALLLSWQSRQPDPAVRRDIEKFLIAAMRDPRLHPGDWVAVDEAAKQVMRRWLAENSLEQFMRVVDRVAIDHQWRYRRAFWNAYFDNDFILDAWVAFASDGASLARRQEVEDAGEAGASYAHLRGRRATDQAVLLLQIGDLLVADWSHNGKVRIWSTSHGSRPKLYQSTYDAHALRADADFEERHSRQGHWQQRTHEFIHLRTGIRLSRTQYMPEDWRGI